MSVLLEKLSNRVQRKTEPAIKTPGSEQTFHEWLHTHAKARVGANYQPYTTHGREPLAAAILIIDHILGNDCSYAPAATRLSVLGTETAQGPIIPDARLDICGGAQFGKTILALLLKTYLGTVKYRGCMYCLPDDDLVQGIIDTKERPDIIDQIPYVGKMLQMGRMLTPSGKSVNRKGAMLYTDGVHNAVSMTRGLGKFPTSFTADCVIIDERDDVREEYADYLPGRMTTSDLRLMISIGTQRYHGAGQNALFEEGSQHIGRLTCTACARTHIPEEAWPGICRLSVTGEKSPRDPRLDSSGRFIENGQPVANYHPDFDYYFACPTCGASLNREFIHYESNKPDRITARHWSVRVSQLSCSALPVPMFVSDWCTQAVRKSNKMTAFNCDRLAIPQSTTQKLTPKILDRAESTAPHPLALQAPEEGTICAGIDVGDQCHIVCNATTPEHTRLFWAETVSDSATHARAVALFHTLKMKCLFIDAGPLRNLARDLSLDLNGLRTLDVSVLPNWHSMRLRFPGNVEWEGPAKRWHNLRCAAVEFTGKSGTGVTQDARITPDNKHIYPVISCNRDEAIQAVIDDLLTAADGFAQIDVSGALRSKPILLLPSRSGSENVPVQETIRKHFLAGSCKLRDADGRDEHFTDSVPNHYLLAQVYSRLAAQFTGNLGTRQTFAYESPGTADHHPLDNPGTDKKILL